MSNEIAIALLELMRKTIKTKLEQLIEVTDNNFEKAIKELEENEQ